jgi:putative endonuclease
MPIAQSSRTLKKEMRDERCYYTYIAASRTRVLYVGVTGSIERRITEHKNTASKSFTANYRCNRLV